jgi:uncharacterized membrane protein
MLSSVISPVTVRITGSAAVTLTRCCDPVTPEHVAVISASPAATLRTMLVPDIVVSSSSDDRIACAVTSCVVALDSVAVAVN